MQKLATANQMASAMQLPRETVSRSEVAKGSAKGSEWARASAGGNAPGSTIKCSVGPVRKLYVLNVPTSARNCAIALRNSRFRAGVVVASAYSSSARFNPSSVAARYGLGADVFFGQR